MKHVNFKMMKRRFSKFRWVGVKLRDAMARSKGAIYAATIILTLPISAHADTTVTSILTNFSTYLTSDIARVVAVIAIIGVGFGWMTGRISKIHAISVVGGIAIVFGASTIVTALNPAA